MLLTKRKSAQRRLLGALKAQRSERRALTAGDAALDHEKQLAVVDAVEWAVERWASRDRVEPAAADPRLAHATRLIAALLYLDPRFEGLQPNFVTEIIEAVAGAPPEGADRPQLDAKAAARLLTVEVGAFRR
jgi:hypothetical protein